MSWRAGYAGYLKGLAKAASARPCQRAVTDLLVRRACTLGVESRQSIGDRERKREREGGWEREREGGCEREAHTHACARECSALARAVPDSDLSPSRDTAFRAAEPTLLVLMDSGKPSRECH